MNNQTPYKVRKTFWMPFCLLCGLLLFTLHGRAQEKPPRPISVKINAAQQLNFGKFIPIGIGGSVTVDHTTGHRSSFQGVLLVGFISSPARFIIDADPGTVITMVDVPDATLFGSNGGSLKLHFGEWSIKSPYLINNKLTDISIGGTLDVGSISANPAGFYSGTFQVTFIQE